MINPSIYSHKKIKMDNYIVFASLPDMGQVGGLVSKHLVSELKAEKFANIKIFEKPWVKVKEGLITPVIDTFDLFVNENHKIIILSGNEQPQDPNNLLSLCDSFLSIIKTIGIPKHIYTAGGYHKPQLAGAPRVFAVSTDINTILNLKEQGIDFIGKEIEIITWFNGLIMAIAKEMGFTATGLFSEIAYTNKPQPLAAKSIVKVFSKLEHIKINTDKFDLDYEDQLIKDKNRVDLGQTSKNDSNPGIG